jgi:hypothetical protein
MLVTIIYCACDSKCLQPRLPYKVEREQLFTQKLQTTDDITLLQEIQSVCQSLARWSVYALPHQLRQLVCILKQKTWLSYKVCQQSCTSNHVDSDLPFQVEILQHIKKKSVILCKTLTTQHSIQLITHVAIIKYLLYKIFNSLKYTSHEQPHVLLFESMDLKYKEENKVSHDWFTSMN